MEKRIDDAVKKKLLDTIQNKIGNSKVFKLWFSNIEFFEDSDGNLLIPVKSSYKEYFENNFKNVIKDSVKEVMGQNSNVFIFYQSTINWSSESLEKKHTSSYTISFSLNDDYIFEDFIVGSSNRHAYTLSKQAADNAGEGLPPIFIYGGVGLGKTHLLHAVLHSVRQEKPNMSCLYISCEGFVNVYVEAVRKNNLSAFRSFVRNIDVLAIDDIHFLSNKEASQEEFFHTFNTLYNSKKQIILSSDCPPKEIRAIKEHLISRFMWGQIAEVSSPDYETKVAIIKHKAEKISLVLSDDIINFLATSIKSNIREIEGVLNTIKSASSHSAITLESVAGLIKNFIPQKNRYFTPQEIISAVCSYFNISIRDIKSQKRYRSISLARQVLVYFLKQYTHMNLQDIGELLGNRNHSTIIYSNEKISKLLASDTGVKDILKNVENMLINKIYSQI